MPCVITTTPGRNGSERVVAGDTSSTGTVVDGCRRWKSTTGSCISVKIGHAHCQRTIKEVALKMLVDANKLHFKEASLKTKPSFEIYFTTYISV